MVTSEPTVNTANAKKIPYAQPCSDEMPPKDCLTAWHELTSPLFDINVQKPDQFSGSVKAYLLGRIIFTEVEFDAQTFRRTLRHTKIGASDHLVLEWYLDGGGTGYLKDDSIIMSPKQINLLDYRHSLYTNISDAKLISFTIPREMVQSFNTKHSSALSWDVSSAKGRVLSSFMSELWCLLSKVEQSEARELSNALAGLLNGLLLPQRQQSDYEQTCVRASTLTAVQNFISANLHLSSLNNEYLCQTFNISRSSLYRLFEKFAGVESYIREQRLKRAFDQLIDAKPGTSKTLIFDIAVSSGFTNSAYFSRLFKKTFGVTPSAVLHDAIENDDLQLTEAKEQYGQIKTFKRWFVQA
ncbi:helix-turn-helix domain-containing protein [Myxosarcina sp. GI1]|uniref:helix-turn-helix domain-containing protein n=1 Tax=Myxosarcina sp. GI1 TaxID=1541065 RepID=UPI00055DD0A9|nr:helix-turn-helix domain-containing protein [Myxosarcina sp. GI1]